MGRHLNDLAYHLDKHRKQSPTPPHLSPVELINPSQNYYSIESTYLFPLVELRYLIVFQTCKDNPCFVIDILWLFMKVQGLEVYLFPFVIVNTKKREFLWFVVKFFT